MLARFRHVVPRRRAFAGTLLVLFGTLAASLGGTTAPAGEPDQTPLRGMLDRLASSAIAYRAAALRFSCEERISWSANGKGGLAAFGYVFTFDRDFGFSDYRTPPRKGSHVKPLAPVQPETFGVPAYLGSAYLWIFSFRTERQGRHHYFLEGEEDLSGRRAMKIRFEPVAPISPGVNDWFGTGWVDEQTAQLLKIEAYTPASWATLKKVMHRQQTDPPEEGKLEVERITTWFEVEAKGLRFPSRVELRRERYRYRKQVYGWSLAPAITLEVNQAYRSYEFFGVETSTEDVRPADRLR